MLKVQLINNKVSVSICSSTGLAHLLVHLLDNYASDTCICNTPPDDTLSVMGKGKQNSKTTMNNSDIFPSVS